MDHCVNSQLKLYTTFFFSNKVKNIGDPVTVGPTYLGASLGSHVVTYHCVSQRPSGCWHT